MVRLSSKGFLHTDTVLKGRTFAWYLVILGGLLYVRSLVFFLFLFFVWLVGWSVFETGFPLCSLDCLGTHLDKASLTLRDLSP